MSYESRAYDNEHGDPVVVLVATGTHDVSRLVNMLNRGNTEQLMVGAKVVRQVRRHNGGRSALRVLAAHGGADFTGPAPDPVILPLHADHPLADQIRAVLDEEGVEGVADAIRRVARGEGS